MKSFSPIAFLSAVLPAVLAAPVALQGGTIVPGEYYVNLKPGLDASIISAHMAWVNQALGVTKIFGIGNWNAYYGEFNEAIVQTLRANPIIDLVEPVAMMSAQDAGNEERASLAFRAITTQSGSTWGLAAISSRSGSGTTYKYDTSAGQGTYAYVVDSGIFTSHNEFGGRATWGYNAVDGSPDEDEAGHGTHVAGTIGGATYGVSKRTNLVAVKVLNATGYSVSGSAVEGFNWAVNDITSKGRAGRSVINLSLGGGNSDTWKRAVKAAYEQGVLSVVSAGNGDKDGNPYDASLQSPANAPEAITVASSNATFYRASSSNYGTLVDIFAPGVRVLSSVKDSASASGLKSGTSMAAPHVAGLALYLQSLEGLTTPSSVTQCILDVATAGRMQGDLKGTINLFAYNKNA